MESCVFLSDLPTGHEPDRLNSLRINETIFMVRLEHWEFDIDYWLLGINCLPAITNNHFSIRNSKCGSRREVLNLRIVVPNCVEWPRVGSKFPVVANPDHRLNE